MAIGFVEKIRRGRKNHKAIEDLKKIALPLLENASLKLTREANATIKSRQPYPDYDRVLHPGPDPTATVFTRSNHAKRSNARHQTLLKLL